MVTGAQLRRKFLTIATAQLEVRVSVVVVIILRVWVVTVGRVGVYDGRLFLARCAHVRMARAYWLGKGRGRDASGESDEGKKRFHGFLLQF
jgi:hypothetical protein